jgi:hypothetical protein
MECPNCERLQKLTDEAVEHSVDANQRASTYRRQLEVMTSFARTLEAENRGWRELKVGEGEMH